MAFTPPHCQPSAHWRWGPGDKPPGVSANLQPRSLVSLPFVWLQSPPAPAGHRAPVSTGRLSGMHLSLVGSVHSGCVRSVCVYVLVESSLGSGM